MKFEIKIRLEKIEIRCRTKFLNSPFQICLSKIECGEVARERSALIDEINVFRYPFTIYRWSKSAGLQLADGLIDPLQFDFEISLLIHGQVTEANARTMGQQKTTLVSNPPLLLAPIECLPGLCQIRKVGGKLRVIL